MAYQTGEFFPSAARTATPTAAVVAIDENVNDMEIVIAVTAATSTPSTVFNVEGADDLGTWYLLLASAAIVGVGTTVLRLGPAVTAAANVAAQTVLPRHVRVRPVHGNANSQTYSVGFRARG
jgi:hypothetical protein